MLATRHDAFQKTEAAADGNIPRHPGHSRHRQSQPRGVSRERPEQDWGQHQAHRGPGEDFGEERGALGEGGGEGQGEAGEADKEERQAEDAEQFAGSDRPGRGRGSVLSAQGFCHGRG